MPAESRVDVLTHPKVGLKKGCVEERHMSPKGDKREVRGFLAEAP